MSGQCPGWIVGAALGCLLGPGCKHASPPAQPLAGNYELVFEDEFDGTALNPAVWAAECRGCKREGEEQQAYRAGNAVVGGGTLKLVARRESADGLPFTSARVWTKGLKEFTYGRVVARMKLPVGTGFWPAFWLLGNDLEAVGWPRCGEIDIMENAGEPNWTQGAVHGPFGPLGKDKPRDRHFILPTSIADWHQYRVDWDPTSVEWYVDDRQVWRIERGELDPWVFDHPQFLIINLGVGGDAPFTYNKTKQPYLGVPQATVDLVDAGKGVVEVDWVRVFQRRQPSQDR